MLSPPPLRRALERFSSRYWTRSPPRERETPCRSIFLRQPSPLPHVWYGHTNIEENHYTRALSFLRRTIYTPMMQSLHSLLRWPPEQPASKRRRPSGAARRKRKKDRAILGGEQRSSAAQHAKHKHDARLGRLAWKYVRQYCNADAMARYGTREGKGIGGEAVQSHGSAGRRESDVPAAHGG